MGLGEALLAVGEDPNAYYIDEPRYSLIVTGAGILGLSGLLLVGWGLIDRLKG